MTGRVKNKSIFIALFSLVLFSSFSCYAGGKEYLNDFEKYKGDQEKVYIKRFKENVRREGDTLYFKIESGEYLTLKNNRDCDTPSPCDFEFIDYFSEIGFYHVFVGYYEWENHMMISDKDGKKKIIRDFPMLSPDKNWFVVVSACDAFCINSVFIWRIVDGKLVSDFSYEPGGNTQYEFIEWKDNRTIYLANKYKKIRCPDSRLMSAPATIRLEEAGWKLYENSSNVRCDDSHPGSPISEEQN